MGSTCVCVYANLLFFQSIHSHDGGITSAPCLPALVSVSGSNTSHEYKILFLLPWSPSS